MNVHNKPVIGINDIKKNTNRQIRIMNRGKRDARKGVCRYDAGGWHTPYIEERRAFLAAFSRSCFCQLEEQVLPLQKETWAIIIEGTQIRNLLQQPAPQPQGITSTMIMRDSQRIAAERQSRQERLTEIRIRLAEIEQTFQSRLNETGDLISTASGLIEQSIQHYLHGASLILCKGQADTRINLRLSDSISLDFCERHHCSSRNRQLFLKEVMEYVQEEETAL